MSPTDDKKLCVRYLYSRDTWSIWYMDKEGAVKQRVADLAPARFDAFGNALNKEQYEKEIDSKKTHAMRVWNDLDQSDRARFDVPE